MNENEIQYRHSPSPSCLSSSASGRLKTWVHVIPCCLLVFQIFFTFVQARAATYPRAEPVMVIGLSAKAAEVHLGFPSGGDMLDDRGRRVKSFRAAERVDWSLAAEKAAEVQSRDARRDRRRRVPRRETLIGKAFQFVSRRSPLSFNGRLYRGTLTVAFMRDGARVTNRLGLEDYVRGVVGGEMGSLSPSESLKAQAIIARTFADANRGKHGRDGYDLCAFDHCQVYGGVGAERATVNQAVDATRGVIMISNGRSISTMYHATCGGMTSNNDAVYGGTPAPYLRRVKCPFCSAGFNFRWTRRIPISLLLKRLATERITFTSLLSADTISPAPLDRVEKLRLHTERGVFSLKGTLVRKLFSLPSTTFIVPAPVMNAPRGGRKTILPEGKSSPENKWGQGVPGKPGKQNSERKISESEQFENAVALSPKPKSIRRTDAMEDRKLEDAVASSRKPEPGGQPDTAEDGKLENTVASSQKPELIRQTSSTNDRPLENLVALSEGNASEEEPRNTSGALQPLEIRVRARMLRASRSSPASSPLKILTRASGSSEPVFTSPLPVSSENRVQTARFSPLRGASSEIHPLPGDAPYSNQKPAFRLASTTKPIFPLLDTRSNRKLPLVQVRRGFSELVLYGRGYGHQVGLCQSGAIEAGRRGWTYRQILPFYYRGVVLRRLSY
ncbi:MAG: SpoIID/LytB domain-containing protein [Candidatus Ozemobacteraceae bacterium]